MLTVRWLALLFVTALLVGCGSPGSDTPSALDPPTGSRVEVQFRRDALGRAADLPVSPTTNSINGAQVSLSGSLTQVTRKWLVLEIKGKQHWISRDSVLLVIVRS